MSGVSKAYDMGLKPEVLKLPGVSTSPLTDAAVRQSSVLGDKWYGPGRRPYWEMKESRERTRYPNFIRDLAKEPDRGFRRQLWESHKPTLEQPGSHK